MSLAGHSALLEHALPMQCLFDPGPHAWAGIIHRQDQLGLFRNVFQVAHQFGAARTTSQVSFFFLVPAVFDDVRQGLLEFFAIHFFLPPPLDASPYSGTAAQPLIRREAFSALLSFSRSRSFMRALCSCDLLFPIEQPIISAISLCS